MCSLLKKRIDYDSDTLREISIKRAHNDQVDALRAGLVIAAAIGFVLFVGWLN